MQEVFAEINACCADFFVSILLIKQRVKWLFLKFLYEQNCIFP